MIARHLMTACLIYASLVLQSCVASDLKLGPFQPWLPGVALVLCVSLHDGIAVLLWAGLLGLGVDSLSAERLGVHVVLSTLVAAGLMSIRQDQRSLGMVSIGVLAFAGTIVWRSASAATQGLLANQILDPPRLLISACGVGVYSTVLTMGLLLLVRLLKNSIGPSRRC